MSKLGSSWIAAAVLAAGLGFGASANAYWTFGSGSTVAADGSGVSITSITGAYAANGGTLSAGAAGTSIVAAGTSCNSSNSTSAANQCAAAGTTGSQYVSGGYANTYGINGFAGSGTTWVSGDSASTLQFYSGGGKGMASDSTLGTAPNHALDNGPGTNSSDLINGKGNTEAVLLGFSSSVVLSSIGVGYKFGDADISLFRYVGGTANPANGMNGVNATSVASMLAAGWELVGNYGDLAVDTTNPYNVVNSGNKGSSWWLISAYNTSYGAATTGTVDQGNDFFKLYAVAGTKCSGGNCGGVPGSSVPEPSSIALVVLGLVGAFGMRRRGAKALPG